MVLSKFTFFFLKLFNSLSKLLSNFLQFLRSSLTCLVWLLIKSGSLLSPPPEGLGLGMCCMPGF